MQRRKLFKKMSIAVLLLLAIVLVGCGGNDTYVETFDEPGTWSAGSDIDVDGDVRDGMYDLLVKADNLLILGFGGGAVWGWGV
jgi:major membrane immunogen (membrane-anchored lipoprotein)